MGVVSRRWMWVESMGVVVRRYINYIPHTTYLYSSCICSFLQQHPYFLFILKKNFVLYNYTKRTDNYAVTNTR